MLTAKVESTKTSWWPRNATMPRAAASSTPTMISSRITVITERYRMSSSVKMMTTVTAVILRIDLLPACCMSDASGAAPAT